VKKESGTTITLCLLAVLLMLAEFCAISCQGKKVEFNSSTDKLKEDIAREPDTYQLPPLYMLKDYSFSTGTSVGRTVPGTDFVIADYVQVNGYLMIYRRSAVSAYYNLENQQGTTVKVAFNDILPLYKGDLYQENVACDFKILRINEGDGQIEWTTKECNRYFIDGQKTMEYLIREDETGRLTLWEFFCIGVLSETPNELQIQAFLDLYPGVYRENFYLYSDKSEEEIIEIIDNNIFGQHEERYSYTNMLMPIF